MASDRTRQSFRLFVGAMLTVGTSVVGGFLTSALTDQQGLLPTLGWGAAGIIATFFYLRWQSSPGEGSPDAIEAQVGQLRSELRSQVQSRSYAARSKLIAAPLKELHLDITPRVGWVRDPRLTEPEPVSEEAAGIVAAFKSSKRRLLIVGDGERRDPAATERLDKLRRSLLKAR